MNFKQIVVPQEVRKVHDSPYNVRHYESSFSCYLCDILSIDQKKVYGNICVCVCVCAVCDCVQRIAHRTFSDFGYIQS